MRNLEKEFYRTEATQSVLSKSDQDELVAAGKCACGNWDFSCSGCIDSRDSALSSDTPASSVIEYLRAMGIATG
jgi:hypothetical protein